MAGYLLCPSCWSTRHASGPDDLPPDELSLFDGARTA
jgi:hypothetical protein